jgi:NitT/TauT family transport system substrate-binding protein
LAHGKLAGPTAEDVIGILAQSIQIKDTAILKQATPNWVDPNVRLNVASMQHDLEFYRSQGLIQSAVTAQGCIDSSIAEEAVQQLGPYKPVRK